jgi:hypothetical protein
MQLQKNKQNMSKQSMTGLLKRVTPIETISTKKGTMQKRYLILDTETPKANLQALELWDDHCSLCQGIAQDTRVTVYYDTRCTLYDVPGRAFKAYVSLYAWRVLEHPKFEPPRRMKDTWAERNAANTMRDEDNPLNWLP